MADLEKLWPYILSWEGGFSNTNGDKGGATKYGVTISTWKAQGYDKDGDGDIDVDDLRKITSEDAMEICRRNYWNRWKADGIKSQSVANLLVDWVWASGSYGITIPQRVLRVKADGIVGPKTLMALNGRDSRSLFQELKAARAEYIRGIVRRDPSQEKFLEGWLNRLKGISFGQLKMNTVPTEWIKWLEE
jgi:lysozyme family protein